MCKHNTLLSVSLEYSGIRWKFAIIREIDSELNFMPQTEGCNLHGPLIKVASKQHVNKLNKIMNSNE